MFYDRITRRVHIEIDGNEYLLVFTLGGLEELESRAGRSLIDLSTGGQLPSLKILMDAFFIAIRDGGNGHRYTRQEAERLAQTLIDEHEQGIVGLANVFFATIAASGLIGAAFREQIFQKLGIENKDMKEKNAMTTEPVK